LKSLATSGEAAEVVLAEAVSERGGEALSPAAVPFNWMQLVQIGSIPTIQAGSLIGELWNAYRGTSGYPGVPAPEGALRTVGEAMLDRTFSLAMNAMTGFPNREVVREMESELEKAHEMFERRGWFDEPLDYHPAPPPVETWKTEERAVRLPGKLVFDHITFDSAYAPHRGEPGRRRWLANAPNRKMHAYVMEHTGEPNRPWLVCVHGFSMGTPTTNFVGFNARHLHEELGLNLIFPVLPLHGPRTAGFSGGEILKPDYMNLVHMFAQSVWDIRRSIDWVRQRGGRRVGLYGISLGGYNVAMTASMDSDLECVIAGIPMVNFVQAARDNSPWVLDWYHGDGATDWKLMASVIRVVSPLTFRPKVPLERRFIYAGRADRVARPSHARALGLHWGSAETHWYSGGHVFGSFKKSVQNFVDDCLRRSDFTTH
jgi:dienelactone hydrolase